ncbi:MAG: phosphoglucomutase/phosphomannomutase family protein [Solobacterium sp.]|nr:phosphoglucomutase/phosphomannomutase family protein [Solobacterium sp.]
MIHFGTGGWRAVIGDEFTKSNIQLLAKAMVEKMKHEGVSDQVMVIGYDRRFLAKEAMQWMAEVFAAEGISSKLINRSCPTPLVMFYVQQKGLPYGMMVTASHNPALYNGVKVFTAGGRDADLEQTADIERFIGEVQEPVQAIPYEEGVSSGLIEEINPINEYLDSILDDINVTAIRNAGLKIALDPMYGVSETAIKTILITARCEVETIHGNHDTLFGRRMPAPNPEAMRELSNYVVQKECDLGIATDGDADRIGIIDNNGRYLSPNDILVLLYWYLVKYRGRKGPCVRNLCTTHILDRLAESFHETCYEVPVGFKWVSAKMDETGAIIGGESSGGMAIQGRIKGKDGVYAAALLTEMLAVTGRKMSEIYDEIQAECGSSFMAEHNYRFSEELKESFLKRIMEDKEVPPMPLGITDISYMDGCKIRFENGGWVSVRFSGTEPLLRVFCEMPTKDMAEQICAVYRDYLNLNQ